MPQVSIPCAVGASADAEIAACRTNPADTLPASCLRKPATGSFIAAIGMSCFPTHLISLLKRETEK